MIKKRLQKKGGIPMYDEKAWNNHRFDFKV